MTVFSEVQVYSNPYYPVEPLPESNSIALARIDTEGVVHKINSAGTTLWGWKSGDYLPAQTLHSLLRDEALQSMMDIQGHPVETTCITQHDGWLLIGKVEKNEVSATPKSSIKTLIENTPSFHHSFSQPIPQGLLFLDRAGQLLYCNQKFKEFALSKDNSFLPGTSYLELDFNSGLNLKIQHLLQERLASFQHTLIQNSVIEETEFNVYGTPIFDTNNNILGAILSFEARYTPTGDGFSGEMGIEPANARMAQLKNVFVSMMSHEIRTPLGVMNGYAEILNQELEEYEKSTGTSLPPQIKEFVGSIHENAQRILGLVNELFDLSNMRQLRLSPIPLHECLRPVTDKTSQELRHKEVNFNLDLAAEEFVVLSNPKRLSQVLHNLLSNAVKFTHQGSVTLRTFSADSYVGIEISDTGIGISQDYLDQLFTPFVQEDMSLNRKFEGAGLGLAMVKLLIDLMKGRIEVDSKKGQGSTFRIFLPTP